MTTKPSLLDLASRVQDRVSSLIEYIRTTNQLQPSFDADAPEVDWLGIDDLRAAALDDLVQLTDLLSTPREILQQHTEVDFVSRHALDRWNLYGAIPVGETRTFDELATATKLPAKILQRVLRHAMTQRIFCEPQPGVVAHTSVSRLLTQNRNVRDYYGTKCNEVWPAAPHTVDAIEKWPLSRDKRETAYVLAFGHPLYETLAADPGKQARYDNAMGAFGGGDRTQGVGLAVKGYDWGGLGKATVVDVGGGVGTMSKTLAQAFPELECIVQDQAAVVGNVEKHSGARVRFMEHDFFEEQPVKDADVYLFRRVFMEWADADADVVRILQALKLALKKGARVVVQDPHLGGFGSMPLWQERRLRASDLQALSVTNNRPRERDNWEVLFRQAGLGFEVPTMSQVPDSDVSFVEAVWQGEEGQ